MSAIVRTSSAVRRWGEVFGQGRWSSSGHVDAARFQE